MLTILVGLILSAVSCHRELVLCESADYKIIGRCFEDPREYYFFTGYPDFYCFNDSIAVGIPVDDLDDPWLYFNCSFYIDDKGGRGNEIHLTKSASNGQGAFNHGCYQAQSKETPYTTYLFVEDYKNIDADTKELHCKLRTEFHDVQANPDYPSISVIDSTTIVLKRVN